MDARASVPSEPPERAFAFHLEVAARDVDAQGHASNVAILGWLVDAAVAHSDALGWSHDAYARLGATFVVRRHEVDYLAPARAGDRVTVRTWPSALDRATAERRYVASRDDGVTIACARTVWAFVRIGDLRPARIPDELRDTFDPARFVDA